MTRAPSLSLVLLAVGVYLILERKFVPLAVLTFVFVWLYNMFPLILVFAFAYAVTVWLSERRFALGALYATSIGAALGLVINPYFPKDLLLIFHHVHMLLAETVAIDVGGEWYPVRHLGDAHRQRGLVCSVLCGFAGLRLPQTIARSPAAVLPDSVRHILADGPPLAALLRVLAAVRGPVRGVHVRRGIAHSDGPDSSRSASAALGIAAWLIVLGALSPS